MAKQTSTRTPKKKAADSARPIDPAANRPANADESSPETLVPEVVRTHLDGNRVDETDIRERISRRAHELARERGFHPGGELDDWLRAEKELQAAPAGQTAPEDQFTG